MSYCLVVFDKELAEQEMGKDPTRVLADMFVLSGIIVFGPYKTLKEASNAGRTLDDKLYSWAVRQFHSLSEELDNPGGFLHWGDSPDEC